MLACYPGMQPHKLHYEEYIGLWLNTDRILLKRAWAVKLGCELALSKGRIPLEVFDAITPLAEEANAAHYNHNASRSEADTLARFGIAS